MNYGENKSRGILILLAFVFGVLGGILGAGALYFLNGNGGGLANSYNSVYVEESQTIAAIDEVSDAVVSILVFKDVPVNLYESYFFDPFRVDREDPEYEYTEISGGSGFIVSKDGLILTNKHVVNMENADFVVVLNDGTEYVAELVSKDPFDDVAVLKILPPEGEEGFVADFPVVEFGDSDVLRIGQKVLAIGNALGQYENTVTFGIISAVGRDISAFDDFSAINFSGLLQTDASINFGNSGGPLVDLNGEVIGMNVAVAEAASGIGFAIPINDLKPILESVKLYGEIVRPVLGVRFVMLTEDQAREIDEGLEHGALVIGNVSLSDEEAVVSGGAADQAGIRENDIILAVEGVDLTIENPLQKIIRKYNPGDRINLTYWRNGELDQVEVVLKSNKDL